MTVYYSCFCVFYSSVLSFKGIISSALSASSLFIGEGSFIGVWFYELIYGVRYNWV